MRRKEARAATERAGLSQTEESSASKFSTNSLACFAGSSSAGWSEVAAVIDDVRTAVDEPLPLTLSLHLSALEFARDHNVAFYDALILAAAIEAGCETLFGEDFQHGRRFGDCRIVNPFL